MRRIEHGEKTGVFMHPIQLSSISIYLARTYEGSFTCIGLIVKTTPSISNAYSRETMNIDMFLQEMAEKHINSLTSDSHIPSADIPYPWRI